MKENIVKIILGVVAGVLVIALTVETVLWSNDKRECKAKIDQMQSELEKCKKTVDELTTYKEEAEAYKEELETYKVEIDRLKELEEAYNVLSKLEADSNVASEGEIITEDADLPAFSSEAEKEEVAEVPTPVPAPNVIDENGTITSGWLAGMTIDRTPSYEGGEW